MNFHQLTPFGQRFWKREYILSVNLRKRLHFQTNTRKWSMHREYIVHKQNLLIKDIAWCVCNLCYKQSYLTAFWYGFPNKKHRAVEFWFITWTSSQATQQGVLKNGKLSEFKLCGRNENSWPMMQPILFLVYMQMNYTSTASPRKNTQPSNEITELRSQEVRLVL